MNVHLRSVRLAALLVVATLVGCASPAPSGPGTATLDIAGRRGDCYSFGGCAWIARLTWPKGTIEATFQLAFEGPDLAIGDEWPGVLPDGPYELTFEQQLLSDAISNGEREFYVSATCNLPFAVPGGRSVLHVRVSFESERCVVSSSMEQVQ